MTIIRKAAVQAGELIDDLLEFSRLGRQGVSFRSVMMTDLVREAADEVRMVPEGRRIDLVVGELPPCRGDHRLLKLVWINLLTNAFKYTKNRNEARVEVGWMPDDASAEGITYFVKDDGIGFDMKYVHKLFGVFQRLHRKEDFDGTGVGLAIVQRIVQRHGGRVWAEGKVNGGGHILFLPRKSHGMMNVMEILLIEDNPEDVEITLRAFQKYQLANKIHVVRDGEEALECLFGTGRI
ncbi:MAG: ATP-binding protein [Nitrospirota bacterium]